MYAFDYKLQLKSIATDIEDSLYSCLLAAVDAVLEGLLMTEKLVHLNEKKISLFTCLCKESNRDAKRTKKSLLQDRAARDDART